MKLIQAMKQIKDLQRKAEDLRGKVAIHCAHMSYETATYGDKQREQVREWLQAHADILKEILRQNLSSVIPGKQYEGEVLGNLVISPFEGTIEWVPGTTTTSGPDGSAS